MKVLVACEFSGIVRDAFLKKGHEAWSCDLLPTESSIKENHYQGDVREILNDNWDLLIAHPPCTYLSNSGIRHFYENVTSKNGNRAKIYGETRFQYMREAAEFFNLFKNSKIKRVCVENPTPNKYAKEIIGAYDQKIHPYMFGETTIKYICFWLKNLPPLIPTNIIHPPKQMTKEEKKIWYKFRNMGESSFRSKARSRFFVGVADAMAEQWGNA